MRNLRFISQLHHSLPLLFAGFALFACSQSQPEGPPEDHATGGGSSLGGAGSGSDTSRGEAGAAPSGGATGGEAASGGSENGSGGKTSSGGTQGTGGTSHCEGLDSDGDNFGDSCDIDVDGDGLIEVSSLEELDWMRNSLGGYERNDGSTGTSSGCPDVASGGCFGYELTQDLDFDTNTDGVMNSSDTYFDPLGDGSNKGFSPIVNFFGTFEGNGHTIKNLYINRPSETSVGFIGTLRDSVAKAVVVRNVNFKGALTSVTGRNTVGVAIGNVLTLNSKLSGGTLFSSSIQNIAVEGTVICAGSPDSDQAA